MEHDLPSTGQGDPNAVEPTDATAALAAAPAAPSILALHGVTKHFGGAVALERVDFELLPGEIHGLVGENGAGKSTLMKILAGVHAPDEGEIRLRGQPVHFGSPAGAKAAGIGMIYQELSTIGALSVAENVFLGNQPVRPGGLVDWRQMRRRAAAQLGSLGIAVDVRARMGALPLGIQQMVEIARVVFSGAEVIILDEPTSALSVREAERLFALMRQLRAQGRSLVFISHFLEDVLAVADRVTVLKNARHVATLPNVGLSKERLIELMIGRDATVLATSYQEGVELPPPSSAPVILDVAGLDIPGAVHDASFNVRAGEIVGLFGYLGAGMTELARALFGQVQPRAGTIRLAGRVIRPRSTSQAKRLGIAYLAENRRATLFSRQDVARNVTLAHLRHLVPVFFRRRRELEIAGGAVRQTGVRPADPRMLAGHLSGGNQQKVVLARWLTRKPTLLILNEPTRGMDVGAKREVLDLVKSLKAQGVAILLISTEPETVIAEADRILVMSRGRFTKEFAGERVGKDQLLSYA